MSYYKGNVKEDKLCGIILKALYQGPKSSKELFSICKDEYTKFWGKSYSLGVIVSDSEIRYRIRRLLKDGLIRRRQREYSLAKTGEL
jgi:predicted transcriptional regulator